ncbi:probable receptor-like protein kinase At5g18500 [Coffea arabica]|uniref:non-specific serine/threonine protein kinase n=1 Tax=Coffea arabica TaxID=13443 RepID=A0ABM4VFZ0_COFAR
MVSFADNTLATKTRGKAKKIKVDQYSANNYAAHDIDFLTLQGKFSDKESDKLLSSEKAMNADNSSQYDSFTNLEKEGIACESGEKGRAGAIYNSHPVVVSSPLSGLPKFSHLGLGHSFTLTDLEVATNKFSKENVIGQGGYGVVYNGQLINGFLVAVKKILNDIGQVEKEFRVEVEAIGHVRQKKLV